MIYLHVLDRLIFAFEHCDIFFVRCYASSEVSDYPSIAVLQYNMILCELEDILKRQILSQFERLGKSSIMLNGKPVDLLDPDLKLEDLLAAGIDIRYGGSLAVHTILIWELHWFNL